MDGLGIPITTSSWSFHCCISARGAKFTPTARERTTASERDREVRKRGENSTDANDQILTDTPVQVLTPHVSLHTF